MMDTWDDDVYDTCHHFRGKLMMMMMFITIIAGPAALSALSEGEALSRCLRASAPLFYEVLMRMMFIQKALQSIVMPARIWKPAAPARFRV